MSQCRNAGRRYRRDTLCLYLFRPGIRTFLIIPGMERCMGDLVNQCLHGLDFAHAVLNGNPIIRGMKISLGTSPDLFKANRDRRCLLQRGEQTDVPIDGSDQFFGAKRWKLFSFGLADIKDRRNPERRTFYLHGFLLRLAVCIQHRLPCLWINYRFFFHDWYPARSVASGFCMLMRIVLFKE